MGYPEKNQNHCWDAIQTFTVFRKSQIFRLPRSFWDFGISKGMHEILFARNPVFPGYAHLLQICMKYPLPAILSFPWCPSALDLHEVSLGHNSLSSIVCPSASLFAWNILSTAILCLRWCSFAFICHWVKIQHGSLCFRNLQKKNGIGYHLFAIPCRHPLSRFLLFATGLNYRYFQRPFAVFCYLPLDRITDIFKDHLLLFAPPAWIRSRLRALWCIRPFEER